ncbi:hypothetical protein [Agarivorans sp. QJM3NY_25]|uniref:hypothetical protein n=1 Tax=Agarivorans sp. QJM3NY_25 TaxID=3421430 RepID=UPI003D7E3F41
MDKLIITDQPDLPQDLAVIADEQQQLVEHGSLSAANDDSYAEDLEFGGEELAEFASIGIMAISEFMKGKRGDHWEVKEKPLARFELKLARYLSTTSMADLPPGLAVTLSGVALFAPALITEVVTATQASNEAMEHEGGEHDTSAAA